MTHIWIENAADLRPGDVIGQQFGADRPAIERVEWLDADRLRLHFVDGTTGRVKVSGGRIRLTARNTPEMHSTRERIGAYRTLLDSHRIVGWTTERIREEWAALIPMMPSDGAALFEYVLNDAGLGVDHIWTNVRCPAYRSLVSADCTCNE